MMELAVTVVDDKKVELHICFFFSSRRRHTRSKRDWSSDVCSSDLTLTTRTLLTRMCRRYPTLRQLHLNSGNQFYAKRQYHRAIEAYDRELGRDGSSFDEIGRASCRERV